MVPEGLGLIITAHEGEFLLWSGGGGAPLRLGLDGYERRFTDLIDVCRDDRIGLFLGGLLPLSEDVARQLGECAGGNLHLSADREFRGQLKRLLPGVELPLSPAERPSVNALPVTLFSLVRDPVWRLLQDLAIPLPRRLALAVEEPWLGLRADRDRLGEVFGHFLDTGGWLRDRVFGRTPPPHPSLAWGLAQIFPRTLILEPAAAAALGLRARWRASGQPSPERWLLVYAGRDQVTAWALKGERVFAGVSHATAALSPARLNDLLAQLSAGWRLEEEIRLDGGLYAGTRLLPEEPGPWRPVIVAGPAAGRFSALADRLPAGPDGDGPLALVAEGLAALLTSPRPPAS